MSAFENHRRPNLTRRPRITRACLPCAKAKTRCDDGRPCEVSDTDMSHMTNFQWGLFKPFLQRCRKKGITSECVDVETKVEKRFRDMRESCLSGDQQVPKWLPSNRIAKGISLIDFVVPPKAAQVQQNTGTGSNVSASSMTSGRNKNQGNDIANRIESTSNEIDLPPRKRARSDYADYPQLLPGDHAQLSHFHGKFDAPQVSLQQQETPSSAATDQQTFGFHEEDEYMPRLSPPGGVDLSCLSWPGDYADLEDAGSLVPRLSPFPDEKDNNSNSDHSFRGPLP